jgi:hypothetical protein
LKGRTGAALRRSGVLRSVHLDGRDGSYVDHAVYPLLREEVG